MGICFSCCSPARVVRLLNDSFVDADALQEVPQENSRVSKLITYCRQNHDKLDRVGKDLKRRIFSASRRTGREGRIFVALGIFRELFEAVPDVAWFILNDLLESMNVLLRSDSPRFLRAILTYFYEFTSQSARLIPRDKMALLPFKSILQTIVESAFPNNNLIISTRCVALQDVSTLVRMVDSEVSDIRDRILLMALLNLAQVLPESMEAADGLGEDELRMIQGSEEILYWIVQAGSMRSNLVPSLQRIMRFLDEEKLWGAKFFAKECFRMALLVTSTKLKNIIREGSESNGAFTLGAHSRHHHHHGAGGSSSRGRRSRSRGGAGKDSRGVEFDDQEPSSSSGPKGSAGKGRQTTNSMKRVPSFSRSLLSRSSMDKGSRRRNPLMATTLGVVPEDGEFPLTINSPNGRSLLDRGRNEPRTSGRGKVSRQRSFSQFVQKLKKHPSSAPKSKKNGSSTSQKMDPSTGLRTSEVELSLISTGGGPSSTRGERTPLVPLSTGSLNSEPTTELRQPSARQLIELRQEEGKEQEGDEDEEEENVDGEFEEEEDEELEEEDDLEDVTIGAVEVDPQAEPKTGESCQSPVALWWLSPLHLPQTSFRKATVVANEILKHIKSSTSMPLMRQMLETALFVLEKDKGVLVENAFAAFAILQPLVMELIEKLDSLSATPNTKQEEVQEVQLTLDLVNSIYRKLTYKFRKSPLNVEFISKAFNLYESMSTPSAQLRALQTTQIVTNCHLMLPLGKNFPDYTLKLMCKIIGKGQPECRAKVLHILHGLMAGTASAEELFQIPNTNIVKTSSMTSSSSPRLHYHHHHHHHSHLSVTSRSASVLFHQTLSEKQLVSLHLSLHKSALLQDNSLQNFVQISRTLRLLMHSLGEKSLAFSFPVVCHLQEVALGGSLAPHIAIMVDLVVLAYFDLLGAAFDITPLTAHVYGVLQARKEEDCIPKGIFVDDFGLQVDEEELAAAGTASWHSMRKAPSSGISPDLVLSFLHEAEFFATTADPSAVLGLPFEEMVQASKQVSATSRGTIGGADLSQWRSARTRAQIFDNLRGSGSGMSVATATNLAPVPEFSMVPSRMHLPRQRPFDWKVSSTNHVADQIRRYSAMQATLSEMLTQCEEASSRTEDVQALPLLPGGFLQTHLNAGPSTLLRMEVPRSSAAAAI